ncbi:MAG: hypothetical protein V4523_08000 [Pseudomonadota bacterium]
MAEIKQSIPINLLLADVRQALFDAAKSDPDTSNVLRYESGRAVGLMGNAMDTIADLIKALEAVKAVRVCKESDNIWAGADRARKIAEEAITRATGAQS